MAADASAAALMPRTIAEKEREENMLFVQLEALAKDRRDHLSTRDFKERRAEFVPSRNIVRRVDQAGTDENRSIQGEARKHLTAWNSVYKDLQDDGTADLDLGDVNEGELTILHQPPQFCPTSIFCATQHPKCHRFLHCFVVSGYGADKI